MQRAQPASRPGPGRLCTLTVGAAAAWCCACVIRPSKQAVPRHQCGVGTEAGTYEPHVLRHPCTAIEGGRAGDGETRAAGPAPSAALAAMSPFWQLLLPRTAYAPSRRTLKSNHMCSCLRSVECEPASSAAATDGVTVGMSRLHRPMPHTRSDPFHQHRAVSLCTCYSLRRRPALPPARS